MHQVREAPIIHDDISSRDGGDSIVDCGLFGPDLFDGLKLFDFSDTIDDWRDLASKGISLLNYSLTCSNLDFPTEIEGIHTECRMLQKLSGGMPEVQPGSWSGTWIE